MNKTTRLKKPQIPKLDTLYVFDDLGGRPKYGGVEMTSETDIPSFQEIMDETHSAVIAEATARDDADEELQEQIDSISSDLTAETTNRENADINLQSQIDVIVASSDVKDIVWTKADLDNYDTTELGDKDIIKVLQDETHNDKSTYYRWFTATSTFTLIGEEGPYYTKAAADAIFNTKADKATTYTKNEVDSALSNKQDTLTAGNNISIVDNTISAIDTTYTAGNGLALSGTEFSADTTVLATKTDLTTKQNTLTAGTNITIANDTISATDTTYTAGNGLALNGTEFSADTTVLATQSDLANKQDTLTAGDNITITAEGGDLVISAEVPATLTDAQYLALWSNPNPLNALLTTISTGGGV